MELTETPRHEPSPVGGVATVAGRGRPAADVADEVMAELAAEPRVLECDLSGLAAEGTATAEQFAPVGHYLQHWPGTVVLMHVPDPVLRSGLASTEYAGRLVINARCDADALQSHRLLPRVRRRSMSLSPAPTAAATARAFVADTMQDWQLVASMASASQVLSAFVAHAVIDADTDIDVSLSRVDSRIRIATTTARAEISTGISDVAEYPLTGRSRLVVQALVDAWGATPVRPAGRSVWAVMEAARVPSSGAALADGDEPPAARHRGLTDPDVLVELHNRRVGRHRTAGE